MDDRMQGTYAAELEAERRLADFARARLTPDAASKARSRARVMREFRLGVEEQAGARVEAEARELDRARSRRTLIRRGATLVLAAGLSIGMVGGALAASTAGGPLYDARIWLEEVTLPSDAASRAAAELTRLETRIAELEAAMASGDRGAAAAALAAYEQIADEAVAEADASTDEALIAKLTALLDRHVATLQRVAGQVPPQAADVINGNIERAIERNDAAIQRIQTKPPTGEPNSENGNGPAVMPGQSAKPAAATAEPVVTPKPHPTAKPEPTPKPQPTPKPPNEPPGQSASQGQGADR
jgi:hypothetical protein